MNKRDVLFLVGGFLLFALALFAKVQLTERLGVGSDAAFQVGSIGSFVFWSSLISGFCYLLIKVGLPNTLGKSLGEDMDEGWSVFVAKHPHLVPLVVLSFVSTIFLGLCILVNGL